MKQPIVIGFHYITKRGSVYVDLVINKTTALSPSDLDEMIAELQEIRKQQGLTIPDTWGQ